MRNTRRWGLAVLGLVLCGIGVGVFFLWPTRPPGSFDGAKNVKWREVEMVVGDKKAVIRVGKFAKPLPHKTVPISETRRDTPLDTWVSIRSHALAGKGADDLDRYASHFLDPNYLLDFVREKVKLSPEKYFEKLRKTNRRPAVIGIIEYGDYTLVVHRHKGAGRFAQYTYTSSWCLVKKGRKYYIDEQAKETHPVLKDLWKELSDSKFKIIDEPQGSVKRDEKAGRPVTLGEELSRGSDRAVALWGNPRARRSERSRNEVGTKWRCLGYGDALGAETRCGEARRT